MIESTPYTIFPDACYIVEKYSALSLEEIESILSSTENISLPVWTGLNVLKEVKSGIDSGAVNSIYRGVLRHARLLGVSVEPIKVASSIKTNRLWDFVSKVFKLFRLNSRPASTKSTKPSNR
jgi:hypothetical protein